MRAAAWTLLILLALVVGYAAWASRPAIDPIATPARQSFDASLVARGTNLSAIGNCATCHTAADGRSFVGGRAVPTPFGVIYSTNITPDRATGIGAWSEQAFVRALREGVDREGRHLYPAFPYDHFTALSDEDCHALYAYFMTREPVTARAPANRLPFPLNIRAAVAGWKALYFRPARFQPDPQRDQVWNRGAYLVQGVGHCGACHTPRNGLGAERRELALSGGEAEGWNAYALDRHSPAPVPWDVDTLASYLRHGWHHEHGIARGPMTDVTSDLAGADENDVRAIAIYIVSQMGSRSAKVTHNAREVASGGGAIYESACATCHSGARALPFGGIDFSLSTAMSAPSPRNIINVTLYGLHGRDGESAPIMPGFAGAISDDQLAELLKYLRAEYSTEPAWTGIESDIRAARNASVVEGGSWP